MGPYLFSTLPIHFGLDRVPFSSMMTTVLATWCICATEGQFSICHYNHKKPDLLSLHFFTLLNNSIVFVFRLLFCMFHIDMLSEVLLGLLLCIPCTACMSTHIYSKLQYNADSVIPSSYSPLNTLTSVELEKYISVLVELPGFPTFSFISWHLKSDLLVVSCP